MNTTLIEDTHALLNAPAVQRAPSRRTALQAALGVGYAVAAGPLMAQTAIKTPSDGLQAGEIMINVGGTQVPVYRAQPAGGTNLPTVLVVSEIFGVHEYIADVARRFARAGYLALAPELFVRQGDPQSMGEIAKIQSEIIAKVPDEQVMADLDACAQWAAQNNGNPQRLGITGFCWGGRITWLYAAHQPRLRAGVAWYGRVSGAVTPNNPRHPVELATQLKAPVLGLYGGADTGIPLSQVDLMKQALVATSGNRAAQASQFVVYPEAPHAFHADYRATFRAGPAQDGWQRAQDWFKQHL
ncbi:MAG: dienelactone hydrolase family protein [Alphaproteobacteria bacterium]|nr:dienelactone hydrolase family protein [Alphaproteobacteria bacterium]